MATKTDEGITGQKYTRQRSNSDPQPNLEAENNAVSNKEKQKNGDVKTSSLGPNTPQPEKRSKFSTFGKIFKPWKWKRKKKSEKIEKTAVELERKISVRSTREELIKKGVLKEPLDIKPATQDGLPSIEQTSEELNSDQGTTSTIVVEQNHVGQTNKDKSEVTDQNSQENVIPVTKVTTEAEVSQFTTITTQADITPVSSSADTPVLTTAQTRPMVFPTVPAVDKTEPVPVAVTMETAISQPKDLSKAKDASIPDKPAVSENSINIEKQQKVVSTEQNNKKEEEDVVYPDGYEPFEVSEPDLSRMPKKSALKGMGGGDNKNPAPITHEHHSHVNFSHVDLITTPQLSNVIKQASPKPSPKSTPLSSAMARPKLRGGLAHFTTESNKENVPIPVSMPTVPPTTSTPTTTSFQSDDSSSDDEEIRYRDDEENDDEEVEELSNSLAAKVARQDSLAKFLSSRPTRRELVEKNIIHTVTDEQDKERRSAIGTALTRRLSLRPSQEELEQRNILHMQSSEEAKKEKEEKKKFLIRKLSFRPSIEELKERKIIQFNDYVEWTEAHEYDRRADKPWTRLTPKDKAAIRKELNEFKSKEMDVHEESKHLTRFHRP